jgi:REP element-mobilizing transposase RayT
MGHPPRIPVWLRWEQSVIYFVTICVANRKPVLANKEALKAFNIATARLQEWRVLAAMLMPDHLHAVVSPRKDRDAKLGNFSGALKRWMREELNASWNWQPGCFDRLLRSDESLHENGFTFKRIRFGRGSLKIGRIGHIELVSMKRNEL